MEIELISTLDLSFGFWGPISCEWGKTWVIIFVMKYIGHNIMLMLTY